MKHNIPHIPRKYPGRWLTVIVMTMTFMLSSITAYADRLTAVRTYDTSAISLGTKTAPDGSQFQTIEWKDMQATAETGKPELPVEYFRLLVPVGSTNFRASITSVNGAYPLPLDSRIIPVQIPQKSDGSPMPQFVYPDVEIYSQIYIPEAFVVDDGFIDGCNHIVTVAVCPIAYNDGEMTASAYGEVHISLDYDLCGEDRILGSKPIFPPVASRYVKVDDLVANKADVARFAPRKAASVENGDYTDWYYIIVPESLKEAVNDLVVWKRQKGYTVVVKVVEDILADPEYAVNASAGRVDEASSLRAYLQDEFAANGAFFCFLIGNSRTSMPIRKATWKETKRVNYEDGTYEYVEETFAKYKTNNGYYALPTDAYFSDLTQHWELRQEFEGSIFTVPSSELSYNPDIYIGRLLCSTPEEISNYLEKLLIYESNPGYGDNGYLDQALFFESADNIKGNTRELRPLLANTFNIEFLEDTGFASFPTGKDVIDSMSVSGFSSWHGHGMPYSVYCTAEYHNDADNTHKAGHAITSMDFLNTNSYLFDEIHIPAWISWEDGNGIDKLSNFSKPSVAYSISCTNTPFDRIKMGKWDYDSTYNLGEAFTIATKAGGVAFLGNTRVGYISTSPKIEVLFLKNILKHNKIGISEAISKTSNVSKFLSCSHNLVGDPEFEMWLGKPEDTDVRITFGTNSLNINNPSQNKLIMSISDGTGNFEKKIFSSSTGSFVSTMVGGDFALSAWRSGMLPIISYYGQNNTLTGVRKSFIVRDAVLGNSQIDFTPRKFNVGLDASLSIRAIDSITSTELFEVDNGGTVELKCDREIELKGSTVKNGGELTAEGKTVRLGPGFKIEKGGKLIIKANK